MERGRVEKVEGAGMSDLISRKALLDSLKTRFDVVYGEDGRLLYSDHMCTGEDVEDLIKLVNNQPTAYDIDKIVEQLEGELYKGMESLDPVLISFNFGINKAIEIVKGGAV